MKGGKKIILGVLSQHAESKGKNIKLSGGFICKCFEREENETHSGKEKRKKLLSKGEIIECQRKKETGFYR